jgi:hypothetical protein
MEGAGALERESHAICEKKENWSTQNERQGQADPGDLHRVNVP